MIEAELDAQAAAVGLKISEIFCSLQGEGASAGQRSMFLRLAGCNLRCSWCDTKYTWDWQNYDVTREVKRMSTSEVRRHLVELDCTRLVITGGEPLLQQAGLALLLQDLNSSWFVEVETNGTVMPSSELLARVNQWNVSPKLSHAGDPASRRVAPEPLRAFKATGRAYLKIVVAKLDDAAEINELIALTAWPKTRVVLVPEAQDSATLLAKSPAVAELALAHGVGFSSRLHLALWGGKRGT